MAEKKQPTEAVMRIRVRLPGGRNAKLFTTRGPAVNGSVVDLPEDEAQRFCDRELALPTKDDTAMVEAECYTEGGRADATPEMVAAKPGGTIAT